MGGTENSVKKSSINLYDHEMSHGISWYKVVTQIYFLVESSQIKFAIDFFHTEYNILFIKVMHNNLEIFNVFRNDS